MKKYFSFYTIYYLKMCITPKKISKIIPKILAYTPNFSPEYFPIKRPKNVNEAAHVLKIIPERKTFSVIALRPNPVEKLSKLTEIDINIILNKVNSKYFSSVFIKSSIISIPINKRIIPSKKLTLMFKKVIILFPNNEPKRGIKKCIIPTKKHKKIVFFLVILKVPMLKEIENVSIDKEIPIINSEIIIDT